MKARTTDPGTGYDTAGADQSYIVAPNGTPQLRRHINFSPPDTNAGASTAQDTAETLLNMATPVTGGANYITVVNPDYIPP
jgi:hypothetical protein